MEVVLLYTNTKLKSFPETRTMGIFHDWEEGIVMKDQNMCKTKIEIHVLQV